MSIPQRNSCSSTLSKVADVAMTVARQETGGILRNANPGKHADTIKQKRTEPSNRSRLSQRAAMISNSPVKGLKIIKHFAIDRCTVIRKTHYMSCADTDERTARALNVA